MAMKMNRNTLYLCQNKILKRNRKAPHALNTQNREYSCLFFGKGSLTAEASFCGTAFFLAIFSLLCLFRIGYAYEKTQWEMANAVREYACYGTKLGSIKVLLKEGLILNWDETERLCFVHKTEEIPYLGSRFFHVRWYQQLRTSTYEGISMVPENTLDDEWVYAAENGTVYHRREDCIYLKPQIQEVSASAVADKRNRSGGKYKACLGCGKEKKLSSYNIVYITPYGDRWHTDRMCSGLKRTVRRVRLEEIGLPPCSKCGEEEK